MSTDTTHGSGCLMQEPYEIAEDTWVISEIVPAGPDGFVPMNSMLIAGAEPVIVDTGNALSRSEWLDAVFSIVDPGDVRWIFLSHDDYDHTGNLPALLELCPQATLVTTHFTVERVVRAMDLPLERMRWVNPDESFDAGDRTLLAIRPPIFDGPTTRGLFDPTTGVYWAVDTFASLVPEHLVDAADTPDDMWEQSLLDFNRMISPWHTLVDPRKWDARIDAIVSHGMTTVAGGHTPALSGDRLAEAFNLVRRIGSMEAAELLGQPDLDEIVEGLRASAA